MLLVALAITACAQPPTKALEEALSLHDAQIAQIQSMRAEIEVWDLANPKDREISLHFKARWAYSKDNERLSWTDFREADSQGRKLGHVYDTANGTLGFRSMHQSNPSRPKPTASDEAGIIASMGPRKEASNVGSIVPLNLMLLRFAYFDRDAKRSRNASLGEIARLAKSVEVVSETKEAVVLRFTHDLTSAVVRRPVSVEFTFEKAMDYSVTEIVTGATVERVTAWQNVDGLRFAKEIQRVDKATGKLIYRAIVNVTEVNKPIPNADFTEIFSEWTRVRQEPEGLIHIWGPDGRPKRTFATLDEYKKWKEEQLLDRGSAMVQAQVEASSSAWPAALIWALVAGVAAAAVFLVVRRTRAAA